MLEAMLSSPFFGLGLTCAAWCVGVFLQKKTGFLLCNPMLIATIVVVAVLAVFRIPYADYLQGSSMLTLMLSPVTAVLALNVYNQRRLLGEYFLPVIVGCLVGTLTSVGSVLLLCKLMAVNASMTSALLPKSVTTAIAIAISENLGGIPGVTAAAVVIAGVVGYFSIGLVNLLASKGKFGAFAYYCWGAGLLSLVLCAMGWTLTSGTI